MAEHEESAELTDVRLGIRLTGQEKRKLDELVKQRYPGRERMHSAMIGDLINEAYKREIERPPTSNTSKR